MIRVLFAGSFWLGSDARSYAEALSRRDDTVMDEIDFDGFFAHRQLSRPLRGVYRLLRPLQQRDFETAFLAHVHGFRPDVVLVFKGGPMRPAFVRRLQDEGLPVCNIWPDVSPRAHTPQIAETMGCYDLVLSTKARHVDCWGPEYGYPNRCVRIEHGYDPVLHYRSAPPEAPTHDLVMIGNARAEYAALLRPLMARFPDLTVAIGGDRWQHFLPERPPGWSLIGPQLGAAYTEWLRRARIVIAPVQRALQVGGAVEPGDEVTARSFECAGAHVFFVHTRTPGAQAVFDEATEVPMFADAAELGDLIERFLPDAEARTQMAGAAHRRAVPAYGHDARAGEIMAHLGAVL